MAIISGARPVQLVDANGNTYNASASTISSPLPAGTNTIGNVGLVAGTAAIGNVGLVAGTNVIGSVNVVSPGVATSINAATAPTVGTSLDGTTAHPNQTIQVNVTTTAVGTAGSHTVVLQGSLDNTNFSTIATVSPTSTSLTATDASNHAVATVSGSAWRYIRANWTAIPTGWTGTLTALIASA